MVLAYNTRSDLGILSSKRLVNVEFPVYEVQKAKFEAAKKAKDSAKIAKASSDLLARWPNRHVKPGETCKVETLRYGKKPEAAKLAATAQWSSGEEEMRVEVDVVDASFSINTKKPSEGSCVSFFFAPSGFDDTRTSWIVIPDGPEDAPIIKSDDGPIKVTWKRTENGYHVAASIPHTSMKGYCKNWTLLPADVIVNSQNQSDTRSLRVGAPGPISKSGRYYVGLVRK